MHQTALIAFGYWLTRQGVPAVPEFLLVTAVTAAACALVFEIVRRIPPLRPLFGLPLRRRADQIAVTGGAVTGLVERRIIPPG